ncbi:L-type lectin-domain containing receptor kinase IX.1-like [Tripterygium wilfordii]|uniref:L-type lectin-domain containing receptor kinase IX.1-like n=1 Tax=Tripterygium wilfordii TaxID=458696 RepID=UPI0018F842F0|nr:L-type lectin-domain containing receptor kinase IX.1-like [Tripterygium wilfordii]
MASCFLILLLLLSFIFLLPSAISISFQKSRFDKDDNSIYYEGEAKPFVGTIDFTSTNYLCQVGRAFYTKKVPIWDSKSRRLADFTTHFTFSIDTKGRTSYAAGFAFFLAPVVFPIPVNSIGGFLGLYNTTTTGSSHNQIVHVEFDTFSNSDWDPPYGHVGINQNSISSAVTTPWNVSLHSEDIADVWINYNSTTTNLSVSWTYQKTNTYRENSSLSYIVDLREVLPEWVTIGFTAATSNLLERHTVLSWEFSSSLDMEEEDSNGKDANSLGLLVGLPVSASVFLFGAIIAFGICRRKKLQKKKRKHIAEKSTLASINEDLERGAGPRRFSYEELVSATKNFSNDKKLGEGGFGSVYKGYLIDLDMLVAVKKISRGSRQGKKEYVTEVSVISRLRHRNLVKLVGWCHDSGEFLLVYEFMPNGSLDMHLFNKRSYTPLNWNLRYKIALGISSGLLYLHEEWEQCVVHRDIKSSNIMLDSSFNVKLGDFGLARLMDHELGPLTTGLAGTLGYLAPEYISTRRARKESDVYSFGVVALEIVTGRKTSEPLEENSEMGLVEWVWNLYGNENLLSGVDPRLQSDFDMGQVQCLMIVGLWCAHPDLNFRPSIRQAIQVLKFEANIPNLPSRMPVPMFHVPDIPSIGVTGEPLMTTNSVIEVSL